MNRTLLAASICAALASQTADSATFNVTTNADAGAGSLRQALIDANANAEADTIELSAISGQTITLSTGQLTTSGDEITINGAGVTIDAAGTSRVMYSLDTILTINDLTLTGGYVPAGPTDIGAGLLQYYGSLAMDGATVTGNSTTAVGGIAAITLGDVSISNSTISNNTAASAVGGVYLIGYGDMSITDSTISGNVATGGAPRAAIAPRLAARAQTSDRLMPFETPLLQRGGGGASLGGGLIAGYSSTVDGTTISGNTASGLGGGIFLQGGEVSLTNSTVSGNTAGGFAGGAVLYAQKYDALMSNSTIDGNSAGDDGGGVYIAATGSSLVEFSTITGNSSSGAGGGLFYLQYGSGLQHNATIVSNNTAATDPDVGMSPTSTITAEFSLVGVAPTAGTLNADASTVSLLGLDPALNPLAANGGPTETRTPTATSPALNVVPIGSAGCGTTVTTDQRGQTRPFGTACDVGSVEFGILEVGAEPVPTLDRIGLLLMSGLLGIAAFFGFRSRTRRRSEG